MQINCSGWQCVASAKPIQKRQKYISMFFFCLFVRSFGPNDDSVCPRPSYLTPAQLRSAQSPIVTGDQIYWRAHISFSKNTPFKNELTYNFQFLVCAFRGCSNSSSNSGGGRLQRPPSWPASQRCWQIFSAGFFTRLRRP